MTTFDRSQLPTRREALTAGLAAAGALAGTFRIAAPTSNSPYGPFKMGLQSYSLRGLKAGGKPDLDKALQATKDLGLTHWESYVAHIPIDAKRAVEFKEKAASYGVSVIGYGVLGFKNDHDANRKIFEFAKAMGLGYLSADPSPDSFDSLDKLVEEYGVAIGIHNHGPGHATTRSTRLPRRSRTTTSWSAAASTPGTSSDRRKTPFTLSKSSANGRMESTSRT